MIKNKSDQLNVRGVCAGISLMAVRSISIGYQAEFMERLRLIRDTPDLLKKSKQQKKKLKDETLCIPLITTVLTPLDTTDNTRQLFLTPVFFYV